MTAASERSIDKAAQLLRAGELVAFPTETVYGLGADATNAHAVARIFAAKGRPRFNPLISHVCDTSHAARHGKLDGIALRLAEEFWPGPLTLVVERRPDSPICDLVTAGLETVALRVPDHPVARRLLELVEWPVAAPSANTSGHVSTTTARHVAEDLGDKVAMILDAGPTAHGLESTVLHVASSGITVLRPGAVTVEQIETVTGAKVARALVAGAAPLSPGQLERHYAPRARVRLNATEARPGEALLAFGPQAPVHTGPMFNLSPAGDTMEAATRLFAALRMLDAEPVDVIAVMPIPEQGLGEAINDRLRRAALGR